MTAENSNEESTPLEVYVAYEYLPASQYAKLLMSLDSLYEALAGDAFGDDYVYMLPTRRGRYAMEWQRGPWLPLCIDRVETGKSITVRFAAKGESASVLWVNGDFDLVLPMSTAPLCAIGVLLTGGAWGYEKYLAAEKTKAEIQNIQAQTEASRAQVPLTAAQVELTKAQTQELLNKHSDSTEKPRSKRARGAHFEVQSQIQNFYSIVNQPNITKVEVNGIDVGDFPKSTD